MSSENVELAARLMSSLPLDDLARAIRDPGRAAAMAATLESVVDPEVEVERIGPEYTGEGVSYRGLRGFLEFWTDWLEPWESFSIETAEFLDAGDKVVQLARQTGRTESASAPIEGQGAAVMTFRDGTLTRIEFHLDRDRAMKAAGLSE
ncbi:MAG: nuclear transport factor 2 family protein [Solirubrobacterales bacterium]